MTDEQILSTYYLPRFGVEDEQQRVYLGKVLDNIHSVLEQILATTPAPDSAKYLLYDTPPATLPNAAKLIGSSSITMTPSANLETLSVAASGVSAGSYTNANITVLADGRVSTATSGSAGGVISVGATAPVASSGGTTPVISMHVADTTHDGYLSSTDWNTFNNKADTSVVAIRARLATTAALPTNIYVNGVSGIGATLTGVATGVLTVDGKATALGDVLLVKTETTSANNGVYSVTVAGAIGVAYVLTRHVDMDQSAEFPAALISTGPEGAANADQLYECTAVPPVTVGTTSITFQVIGGSQTYTADNSTLELVGTQFREKDGGTTNAKLANMAAHTVKANITGSAAAPTDPTWLSIVNTEVNSANGSVMAKNASGTFGIPGLGNNQLYLDSTGAFSNPTTTGAAGWQAAFDIDFSTLANLTINADGNYSIGGLTWTKTGSAKDAVAMAIVNGTGLVIQPAISCNYSGSTRTAPAIYTDISTLIPAYYINMPIRLWVYTTATPGSGQGAGAGIDNLSSTATIIDNSAIYRGPASAITDRTALFSTTAADTNVASTINTTDQVLVMDYSLGRIGGTYIRWKGAMTGGGSTWPTAAQIRPWFMRLFTTSATISYTDDRDPQSVAHKVVVFAFNSNASGSLSATIVRIKLEYQVR